MSLTSSLYSGVSGLATHGDSMSVISDNIANVSTIGFKSARTTFQDVLSQSVATASGTSQIGRGASMSDVDTLFQQGSFQSTSNATDLAIGGNGFFIVRQPSTNTNYYTRAGQFRFDQDGKLTNPSGYIAQGWALDSKGNNIGSPGDIVLSNFSSPPLATSQMQAITNLDFSATSKTNSLFGAWNAAATPPIGDSSYGYQTSVQVYDSLGNAHNLTVYYDKATAASEYATAGMDYANTWEYIICCNPADDKRVGAADSLPVSGAAKGVLMRGTMTYDASTGALKDMSAYTWKSAGATGASINTPANWTQATFSTSGYPQFDASFVAGVPQTIDFRTGLRSQSSTFTGAANVNLIPVDGNATMGTPEPQALNSTQYASSSTTIYQTQNGYGTGFLETVSVDTDGVMTGHYSNGQILNLFRVTLARFNNDQALMKSGGNLWSSTRSSGAAITGDPGTNGLGKISPNSLEQSNVDMSNEMVNMIAIQRGFQANSRTITTADSMLQELINLKR